MNYLNATPRVEVEPPNPQANNLHSVYTVNEIDSKLEQIRNEVSAHKLAHSKEIYVTIQQNKFRFYLTGFWGKFLKNTVCTIY